MRDNEAKGCRPNKIEAACPTGLTNSKPIRNYGVDLLKIVSMLMVVVLHILGAGVLQSCAKGTGGYYVAWLLNVMCYGAVNCFALCTGYLMSDRQVRGKSLATLWVRVAFYSVLLSVLFACFGDNSMGMGEWLWTFIPVIGQRYWFFTAYFALFFFMPYLNRLIKNLEQKEFKRLVCILLILFVICPIIGMGDIFKLSIGYSTFWLIAMYFVGAYFKKYPMCNKINKKFLGGVHPCGRYYMAWENIIFMAGRPCDWRRNIHISICFIYFPDYRGIFNIPVFGVY